MNRLLFLHRILLLSCGLIAAFSTPLAGQHSVAREWNEVMLEAVRGDFARPTVHARNLFHVSMAMYDAWAIFDENAETYFVGKTLDGFTCPFDGIDLPANLQEAQEEAMSYAAYRILTHRFMYSPGAFQSLRRFDNLMEELGYDPFVRSLEYTVGGPAELGNYIADYVIQFGLQDKSNEIRDYRNRFYEPVNTPLTIQRFGNPVLEDPNRWQPLSLRIFIDQSGNEIPGDTPDFLSPEWGQITPFALRQTDLTIYNRDGFDYWVYHDPGPPPQLNGEDAEEYKWGFALVAAWSAHLDQRDGKLIDISPAAIGNIPEFPTAFERFREFYDLEEGGDPSRGHALNPVTGRPYEPQIVPRADYARVLAEFWADGPDSETPPGHWYTILNYVSDHPMFEKRWRGTGPVLDELEWDVKTYFTLGGALHDAAITAWGIKGWYDYIRPVSAIRYMAEKGQSTDPALPGYDESGIPLIPGFIELVGAGDPLAGPDNENVGKIKLYAWRGPDFIEDEETDQAGVGWILAGNWWPYQRPSFVTPPFAGYVSGHSTFSRAAAEVMTLMTGDPFFPGGIGEFVARKNEFLVFEEGPSVDVVLQWATYRDASDQTSLSRIWGGIHPPADDIPGRIIGEKIGLDAFDLAVTYFSEETTNTGNADRASFQETQVYPNPVSYNQPIQIRVPGTVLSGAAATIRLLDLQGRVVVQQVADLTKPIHFSSENLVTGTYLLQIIGEGWQASGKISFHK